MRALLSAAASVAVLAAACGAASAQAPVASPPGAGVQAGGVPTLQQQPNAIAPQAGGAEPQRAPGSTADQGVNMPLTDNDAGTTTTFATSAPEQPVRWPCAQPKVPTISAGTIWSGPSLADGKDWEDDDPVASLAQKLASRRTPLDETDGLIADFAKTAGAGKNKKLTELFVGVLDIINGNRDDILQGITRYARGQERLAARISTEADKISEEQNEEHGPTGIAVTEANRDFNWDKRIFKERNQALSFVCETPSLLERRAYEIGRRIQAQL